MEYFIIIFAMSQYATRYQKRLAEKARVQKEQRYHELIEELKLGILELRTRSRDMIQYSNQVDDNLSELYRLGYKQRTDFDDGRTEEEKQRFTKQPNHAIYAFAHRVLKEFPTNHYSRMCRLDINNLY